MLTQSSSKLAVWDLPTRVFHWLLAASFAIAWLTAGDGRYLELHAFAGYLALALLSFRLLWGLAGGVYARFASFPPRWGQAWNYTRSMLSGARPRYPGHNPLAALAVYMLLGLGLAVTLTGLAALGGEEQRGPLASVVSFPLAAALQTVHEVLAWLMLGLVGVHVAGVLIESGLHHENLVSAMVTGYKRPHTGAKSSPMHRPVGAAVLVVAVLGSGLYLADRAGWVPGSGNRSFTPSLLADNATWQAECGSCHLAFNPALLPARSWDGVLGQQGEHFGEDLGLDPRVLAELRGFLAAHAAETRPVEAAWKVGASVPSADVPLRITATPYWAHKHRRIATQVWGTAEVQSKANCQACHSDADKGSFASSAVHPPDQPHTRTAQGLAEPAGSASL